MTRTKLETPDKTEHSAELEPHGPLGWSHGNRRNEGRRESQVCSFCLFGLFGLFFLSFFHLYISPSVLAQAPASCIGVGGPDRFYLSSAACAVSPSVSISRLRLLPRSALATALLSCLERQLVAPVHTFSAAHPISIPFGDVGREVLWRWGGVFDLMILAGSS